MDYTIRPLGTARFTKPVRQIDRIVWHSTASDNQKLFGENLFSAVNYWHKDRGFTPDRHGISIGYNGFFDMKGNYIPARDPEDIPCAQAGWNSRSLAYCLHGLSLSDFTDKQLLAMASWATQIDHAYDFMIPHWPHNKVSAKACPVWDPYKALSLDSYGFVRMVVGQSRSLPLNWAQTPIMRPVPTAIRQDWPGTRTIQLTDRGNDVNWIQIRLNITADGIFGMITHKYVVKWQRAHDLLGDGIVGPLTWAAMFEEWGQP